MTWRKVSNTSLGILSLLLLVATHAVAQTPAKALLVLEKDKTQLDIIDPTTLKIVGSVPVGEDPHEVIASADGKTAYVSNYMGRGGPQHKLSVIDLASQKALPAIELGPLQGPHGLDFAGGELYFTAETSKVIGRYDPATQKIDWVMGTGQGRTHLVWVAPCLDGIVTSKMSVPPRSASSNSFRNRTVVRRQEDRVDEVPGPAVRRLAAAAQVETKNRGR